jgi:hypothetical protein
MTRAERIEALMITVLAPASWLAWPYFSPGPPSAAVPLWQITLSLSALLLLHSLIRDVAILLRRRAAADGPRREAQCVCLESTLGLTGVVAGAMLAGLAGSAHVTIGRWEFSLALTATLALGFAVKDLVVSWNPLGLRREKDHLNLIVRWTGRP